jgi:hypothetical protein
VREVRRRDQEQFSFHELVALVLGQQEVVVVGELDVGLFHGCIQLSTIHDSKQSSPDKALGALDISRARHFFHIYLWDSEKRRRFLLLKFEILESRISNLESRIT